MVHKIDQLGNDVMSLDTQMNAKVVELTEQVSSLKGDISDLKTLVLLLLNKQSSNRDVGDHVEEAVTPVSCSSSNGKRTSVELDLSEQIPKKLRSCTILDSFASISLSTAFFQFYLYK